MVQQVFNMEVKGARELEEFMLKTLPAKVNRRTMQRTINEGAKPMIQVAKFLAAKDSGALARSIGIKSWTLREIGGEGGTFAGASVGPMSGDGKDALAAWGLYLAHHGREIELQRGKKIGRIRHGHLVEFGFKMRNGKRYPGRPYMQPAANIAGPGFVRNFVADLKKNVANAVRRHNARSPARTG